jgi:hypothetical protein
MGLVSCAACASEDGIVLYIEPKDAALFDADRLAIFVGTGARAQPTRDPRRTVVVHDEHDPVQEYFVGSFDREVTVLIPTPDVDIGEFTVAIRALGVQDTTIGEGGAAALRFPADGVAGIDVRIFPGAAEPGVTPADGMACPGFVVGFDVDEVAHYIRTTADCDGDTFDESPSGPGGPDCDDFDGASYPGAQDPVCDDVDLDCETNPPSVAPCLNTMPCRFGLATCDHDNGGTTMECTSGPRVAPDPICTACGGLAGAALVECIDLDPSTRRVTCTVEHTDGELCDANTATPDPRMWFHDVAPVTTGSAAWTPLVTPVPQLIYGWWDTAMGTFLDDSTPLTSYPPSPGVRAEPTANLSYPDDTHVLFATVSDGVSEAHAIVRFEHVRVPTCAPATPTAGCDEMLDGP